MKKEQLIFLLFIYLFSCTSSEDDQLIYTVSYQNFENIISIEGFAEPVEFSPLNSPPYIEGSIAFLLDEGTFVEEGDTVCVIENAEIENYYDQVSLNLENAQAILNKTIANQALQYALLEAQVQNNKADSEIARLDSLQLIFSPKNQRRIKELELEIVAVQKNKYEKKLQALKIINQSEIKRLHIEIQNLTNRLKIMREEIDKMILKAPRRGIVVRAVNPQTGVKFILGDNVWSNILVASIPWLEDMKVMINAPEKDFKLITIGDSISYTLDALPEELAWGKVLKKSPVAQPYKKDSKVKFFEIEASIDSATAMPEPGFTVNCEVFLRQIKDTLVVPQIAVFDADSLKVVYVKNGKDYEMRQIITGVSSPKETVVAAGLKAGESIALSKPSDSSVKKKSLLSDSLSLSISDKSSF